MELITEQKEITDLLEHLLNKGQDLSIFFKLESDNVSNYNLIGKISFIDENDRRVELKVQDSQHDLTTIQEQPSLAVGKISFIHEFCKYYFEITPTEVKPDENGGYNITALLPKTGSFRKSRRFIRVANQLPKEIDSEQIYLLNISMNGAALLTPKGSEVKTGKSFTLDIEIPSFLNEEVQYRPLSIEIALMRQENYSDTHNLLGAETLRLPMTAQVILYRYILKRKKEMRSKEGTDHLPAILIKKITLLEEMVSA